MTASTVASFGAYAAAGSTPVPSGVISGSIVLATIYGYWPGNVAASSPDAWNAPAGFTYATGDAYYDGSANTLIRGVYWKRASGAETGTYAFTEKVVGGATGLNFSFGIGIRLVGPASGTPVLGQTTSAETITQELTLSAPSYTPSSAEALLIAFTMAEPSDRPLSSPPSGWTQLTQNVGGATGGRAAVYTATQDEAEATGILTWTYTDAVRADVLAIAIAPAESTIPLDTPTVTLVGTTEADPDTANGSITISWLPVTNADRYEVGVANGSDQTAFTTVSSDATSPYTITGRNAGNYTAAVRAIPAE